MKILILSPLFPPDTGAPATYVKELAHRLSASHEVTLLVYGYLPEAVAGVRLISIDKRTSLPQRLFLFTKAIWRHRAVDYVLINNAPSIELPFFLTTLLLKQSFTLIVSDPIAKHMSTRGWYRWLHATLQKRATKVIIPAVTDYEKAEILPFEAYDAAREARRQVWWDSHSNQLIS